MSHIITKDVLDFNNILSMSNNENIGEMKNLNSQYKVDALTDSKNEIKFSDLEKQLNINAAQISPYHFQLNNQQLHNPQSLCNSLMTDNNPEIGLDTHLQSRDGSQFSITSSYESSPESNFPYTPMDSLDSCTTSSVTGNDVTKKSETLEESVFRAHFLETNKNSNEIEIEYNDKNVESGDPFVQNMDKTAYVSVKSDISLGENKFLLDEFELDQEINKLISGPPDLSFDEECQTGDKTQNTIAGTIQDIESAPQKRSSTHLDDAVTEPSAKSKKPKIETKVPGTPDNKFLRCFSILRSNYLSLCESHNELVDRLDAMEQENKKLIEKSNEKEQEEWKIDKDRFLLEREEMKAMLDSLLHEVTILRRKTRD